MTTPNTEDNSHLARTSLWSVPERWAGAYLALFVTQSLAWLALLIFNEATSAEPVSIVAKAVNVGAAWAPLMVLSAGASMIIVEVPMVFADKIISYRHRRAREEGHAKGREEGHAEGREEGIVVGHAEGREEGILHERARWESYLEAMDEAHRNGSPPPAPPTARDGE